MRLIIRILLLAIASLTACSHSVDPPDEAPPQSYDCWPMVVGNTWTFVYAYNWYNWGITGVGKMWQASYAGTLTWEIASTTQVQDTVKSTFKLSFVGTATELVWTAEPNKYSTNTYNINDTDTFELTVQPDSIIRLRPATNLRWHGNLFYVFTMVDVYRYPPDINLKDSAYTYRATGRNAEVTLVRQRGPRLILYHSGGNSSRSGMDATLISFTQRNERITSGKASLTLCIGE